MEQNSQPESQSLTSPNQNNSSPTTPAAQNTTKSKTRPSCEVKTLTSIDVAAFKQEANLESSPIISTVEEVVSSSEVVSATSAGATSSSEQATSSSVGESADFQARKDAIQKQAERAKDVSIDSADLRSCHISLAQQTQQQQTNITPTSAETTQQATNSQQQITTASREVSAGVQQTNNQFNQPGAGAGVGGTSDISGEHARSQLSTTPSPPPSKSPDLLILQKINQKDDVSIQQQQQQQQAQQQKQQKQSTSLHDNISHNKDNQPSHSNQTTNIYEYTQEAPHQTTRALDNTPLIRQADQNGNSKAAAQQPEVEAQKNATNQSQNQQYLHQSSNKALEFQAQAQAQDTDNYAASNDDNRTQDENEMGEGGEAVSIKGADDQESEGSDLEDDIGDEDEEEEEEEDPDFKVVEVSPKGRFKRFGEELGRGAYKVVYKGVDEDTGQEVAWNKISLLNLPKSDRTRIRQEIDLIKNLKHKNIIHFISGWQNREKKEVIFITEICTGTLWKYIKRNKINRLRVIKTWCQEILAGLTYLHEQSVPIIHRDLKCDNIFINSNSGEIKIGDLGLSTPMHNSYTSSVLGTPNFMAPELYDEHYDVKVDIYAFGMCVLEMITQERPYSECASTGQIYKKVTNGTKPMSLNRIVDEKTFRFISECIHPNKEKRPTARELLSSQFISDKDSEENKQPVKLYATKSKEFQKRRKHSFLHSSYIQKTVIPEAEGESDNESQRGPEKKNLNQNDPNGTHVSSQSAIKALMADKEKEKRIKEEAASLKAKTIQAVEQVQMQNKEQLDQQSYSNSDLNKTPPTRSEKKPESQNSSISPQDSSQKQQPLISQNTISSSLEEQKSTSLGHSLPSGSFQTSEELSHKISSDMKDQNLKMALRLPEPLPVDDSNSKLNESSRSGSHMPDANQQLSPQFSPNDYRKSASMAPEDIERLKQFFNNNSQNNQFVGDDQVTQQTLSATNFDQMLLGLNQKQRDSLKTSSTLENFQDSPILQKKLTQKIKQNGQKLPIYHPSHESLPLQQVNDQVGKDQNQVQLQHLVQSAAASGEPKLQNSDSDGNPKPSSADQTFSNPNFAEEDHNNSPAAGSLIQVQKVDSGPSAESMSFAAFRPESDLDAQNEQNRAKNDKDDLIGDHFIDPNESTIFLNKLDKMKHKEGDIMFEEEFKKLLAEDANTPTLNHTSSGQQSAQSVQSSPDIQAKKVAHSSIQSVTPPIQQSSQVQESITKSKLQQKESSRSPILKPDQPPNLQQSSTFKSKSVASSHHKGVLQHISSANASIPSQVKDSKPVTKEHKKHQTTRIQPQVQRRFQEDFDEKDSKILINKPSHRLPNKKEIVHHSANGSTSQSTNINTEKRTKHTNLTSNHTTTTTAQLNDHHSPLLSTQNQQIPHESKHRGVSYKEKALDSSSKKTVLNSHKSVPDSSNSVVETFKNKQRNVNAAGSGPINHNNHQSSNTIISSSQITTSAETQHQQHNSIQQFQGVGHYSQKRASESDEFDRASSSSKNSDTHPNQEIKVDQINLNPSTTNSREDSKSLKNSALSAASNDPPTQRTTQTTTSYQKVHKKRDPIQRSTTEQVPDHIATHHDMGNNNLLTHENRSAQSSSFSHQKTTHPHTTGQAKPHKSSTATNNHTTSTSFVQEKGGSSPMSHQKHASAIPLSKEAASEQRRTGSGLHTYQQQEQQRQRRDKSRRRSTSVNNRIVTIPVVKKEGLGSANNNENVRDSQQQSYQPQSQQQIVPTGANSTQQISSTSAGGNGNKETSQQLPSSQSAQQQAAQSSFNPTCNPSSSNNDQQQQVSSTQKGEIETQWRQKSPHKVSIQMVFNLTTKTCKVSFDFDMQKETASEVAQAMVQNTKISSRFTSIIQTKIQTIVRESQSQQNQLAKHFKSLNKHLESFFVAMQQNGLNTGEEILKAHEMYFQGQQAASQGGNSGMNGQGGVAGEKVQGYLGDRKESKENLMAIQRVHNMVKGASSLAQHQHHLHADKLSNTASHAMGSSSAARQSRIQTEIPQSSSIGNTSLTQQAAQFDERNGSDQIPVFQQQSSKHESSATSKSKAAIEPNSHSRK